MMKTTDLKIRNDEARKGITAIHDEHGISYISIATTRMGTSLSSFSQWRTGVYQYAPHNLDKIERIIKRYTFND